MIYTTIAGDTWDGVAYKVYGDEKLVGYLMDVNTEHLETVIFSGGIQLAVPELPEENKVNNLPPWKRVKT